MEFEKFKTAWQEQKFEGYLFEKPPHQIEADVRRKAGELRVRHATEDAVRVVGSVVLVGIWIFMYDGGQPLMSRAGYILVAAGIALEALVFLALRFRHRGERFELPREDFLLLEKRRIEERIRLLKGSLTWLSIPMLAGCILFIAPVVSTVGEFLSAVAMLAALWGMAFMVNRMRIKKRMLPLLVEINQKLAESRAKPA